MKGFTLKEKSEFSRNLLLNENKYMNKWYNSSQDPQAISLTIRGMLVAWIPALLLMSQSFGWNWTEALLMNLAILVSGLITAGMIGYGLVRKLINVFKKG